MSLGFARRKKLQVTLIVLFITLVFVGILGFGAYTFFYGENSNPEVYSINYYIDDEQDETLTPSTYTYGVGATLPTPTKIGYVFDGWFEDSAFLDTKVIEISSTETGDKIFYGKFTSKKIEVEYKFVNTTDNGSTVAGSYGVGEVITLNAAASTGYTFSAWTKSSGTGTIGTGNSTSYTITPEDAEAGTKITFTATATICTYTVTIAVNDNSYGTVSVTSVTNVPYGTIIQENGNTIIINGTTITATAVETTDCTISFIGWTNGTATVTSDLTITANFEGNENSVLFPEAWRYEIQGKANSSAADGSYTGMTTTLDPTTLTSIRFEKTIPSDYNATPIGVLSTGIEVYAKTGSTTDIAFVSSDIIYAPSRCYNLFSSSDYLERLNNLTSITFNNFNISKVKNMQSMFHGCSKLTNLDVSKFDTSNVTNMHDMFASCSKLTSLDVSNFDTSNVTDMFGMFQFCPSLTSLDVSNFDTRKVTYMGSMFSNCPKLTSIDVSNFDTSKVWGLQNMFDGCSSLTSIDVSKFDTSNATMISGMFSGCSNLTSLDVSNFDTRKVISIYSIFSGCSKLTSLDVSKFNTSNVINMNAMFSGCSGLTNIDLSNFDTSKVTDMSYMFYGCSNLTSLDVSTFNTSNVTNMAYMFSRCSGITGTFGINGTGIKVSANFVTSKVTDMRSMFSNCSSLTSIDLSNFNTSELANTNSMFSNSSTLTNLDLSSFDTSNVTNMAYMFSGCSSLISLDLSNFDMTKVTSYNDMLNFGSTSKINLLKTPYNNKENLIITANTSGNRLYNTATNTAVTSVPANQTVSLTYKRGALITAYANGGSIANTTGWTGTGARATRVVYYDGNIGTLPTATRTGYTLSGWTTIQNGTDAVTATSTYTTDSNIYAKWVKDGSIFPTTWQYELQGKTNSSASAGSYTGMGDNTLTPANLTKIQFEKTAPADYTQIGTLSTGILVYQNPNATTEIAFVLGKTIYAPSDSWNLFCGLSSSMWLTKLTSLTFNNFNTSNVTNMSAMFNNCSSLTSLDLSNFNTSKVTIMSCMFYGCSGITGTFGINGTGIKISTNFVTSKVTSMNGMFSYCSSLTSIDLSNFNTSKVTDMNYMFYGAFASDAELIISDTFTWNNNGVQTQFTKKTLNSVTHLKSSVVVRRNGTVIS